MQDDKGYVAAISVVLSKLDDKRYVIVDSETLEILDDARGYGYTSSDAAYNAFAHKLHYKPYRKHLSREKEIVICQWMQDNPEFVEAMELKYEEIWKFSYTPELDFTAKTVENLLKRHRLYPDFTARDLLRVWKKL